MFNKMFLGAAVLLILIMAIPAFAQKHEIREYKVQKGDTLWDISKKELNDPFLWPKVWKENPDIAQPDRLTPGQIVRIPIYLIQKEAKAEPVAEPVVEKAPVVEAPVIKTEKAPEKIKPLIDANLYTASGYFSNSANAVGHITGTPLGKTLIANLDMFYIKTKVPARLGDRFFVIRKNEQIHHPITKAPIGSVIEVLGIAEVKKYENGDTLAQLIKIFDDIKVGDLLDTYSDQQPPVISKPFRRPDARGVIIAARQLRMNNGIFDIVYIDRGKKHGIEDGDILQSVNVGKHKVPNGLIQVFKADSSYSVAIVRESRDFITSGNYVIKVE